MALLRTGGCAHPRHKRGSCGPFRQFWISRLGRRKCALLPIGRCRGVINNRDMQVAIRCHRYAPVASDELEDWLVREVDGIRAAAPDATVRLMRLSQALTAGRVAVGWLIELEGLRGEGALSDLQIDAVLRDMRLLGLQPTLLGSTSNGKSP